MSENCLLTTPAKCDILVMPDQPTQDRVFLDKHYHPYLVNIAPRRSQTDESPANWSGNRWRSSYVGLRFLPQKSSAPDTCANMCQRLAIRNGGPNPMVKPDSTIPQDASTNLPEHICSCSQAPSLDPIDEIARLWPLLSARSRECVYALALGLLAQQEARAWRGEASA